MKLVVVTNNLSTKGLLIVSEIMLELLPSQSVVSLIRAIDIFEISILLTKNMVI